MNMTLKDGTKIPIVDGSYTGAVILIVEDRQALMDIWDQLTPDNLQELQITQDDGTVVHTLHGAVIDSQQSVTNPDGMPALTWMNARKTLWTLPFGNRPNRANRPGTALGAKAARAGTLNARP